MKPEDFDGEAASERGDRAGREGRGPSRFRWRRASPTAITASRRTVPATNPRRAKESSAKPSKAASSIADRAAIKTPPSYFLIRGDSNSKGPQMQPGFIKVITYGNPPVELPPASGHTSGRRLALAEWLVSPDNPLTARVIVNRIWHHHFGRGIVPRWIISARWASCPAIRSCSTGWRSSS